jgi:hypothetical protein
MVELRLVNIAHLPILLTLPVSALLIHSCCRLDRAYTFNWHAQRVIMPAASPMPLLQSYRTHVRRDGYGSVHRELVPRGRRSIVRPDAVASLTRSRLKS